VSLDKLDYCASLNNTRILEDKPNFTFEQGDITSPADVKRVLRRHKIDTIFHFAAQSHVDLSFGNSYQFTNTNVYGTHVLLERAREHGISKFIHISTDEVYGDVPVGVADLSETSILAPTNPYSASKAAAEMMVSAYRSSFKLPLITIRANNVYGPHQFPESMFVLYMMISTDG
jgi:dTDP-glucose 4,6-dehydratase